MLKVINLSKSFQSGDATVNAVDDVSFEVPEGQFASIIGKSGSGKTTLLSILGTPEKPSVGSIELDGKVISKLGDHALVAYRRRKIGFVFQGYNLIPNLTALENVMLPMEFAKGRKQERARRAHQLLQQVGLS